MINSGISSSDRLIALITKNSNKSGWVRYEIKTALKLEEDGKGPKILPVKLTGCKLPKPLRGRKYVSIDPTLSGIDEIITGLFPDRFLLELGLCKATFNLDKSPLPEMLSDYFDSDGGEIHIWLHNWDFVTKILKIARRAVKEINSKRRTLHSAIPLELEEKHIYIETDLSLYWFNLSALLAELVKTIFRECQMKSDFIKLCIESLFNSVSYANYFLTGYLYPILNSSLAYETRYTDIAKLLENYEGFHRISLGMSNDERYARNFFNLGLQDEVVLVDIVGERNSKVNYTRCYLWNKDHFDMEEIAGKCHPSQILGDYAL